MNVINPFEVLEQKLDEIERKIDLLLARKEATGQREDQWMSVSEVAAFLQLTKSTIYYYTHKNLIPFSKKGRKAYFLRSQIEQWLKEGEMPQRRRG